MKKSLLILSAFILVFSSCEQNLEFLINHTFQYDYQVDVPEDTTAFTYDFLIDVSSNSELSDNIDNISNFTINSLKYSITDYIGGSDVSGELTFTFYNASDVSLGGSILTVSNLQDFAGSGQKQTLDLTQETINAVQSELLNNQQVKISVDGSVSEVPVNFLSHLYLNVDANVAP